MFHWETSLTFCGIFSPWPGSAHSASLSDLWLVPCLNLPIRHHPFSEEPSYSGTRNAVSWWRAGYPRESCFFWCHPKHPRSLRTNLWAGFICSAYMTCYQNSTLTFSIKFGPCLPFYFFKLHLLISPFSQTGSSSAEHQNMPHSGVFWCLAASHTLRHVADTHKGVCYVSFWPNMTDLPKKVSLRVWSSSYSHITPFPPPPLQTCCRCPKGHLQHVSFTTRDEYAGFSVSVTFCCVCYISSPSEHQRAHLGVLGVFNRFSIARHKETSHMGRFFVSSYIPSMSSTPTPPSKQTRKRADMQRVFVSAVYILSPPPTCPPRHVGVWSPPCTLPLFSPPSLLPLPYSHSILVISFLVIFPFQYYYYLSR